MSLPDWAKEWKKKTEIQKWLKIMYTRTASGDTAQINAQIELYKYITFGEGKEPCISEWWDNIANMPYKSDPEANVYHIKHRASQECNLDWVLSDTLSDDSIDELINNTTPESKDRTNFKKNLLHENIVNWWCYIDHYPTMPHRKGLKHVQEHLKKIIKYYHDDPFYESYEKNLKLLSIKKKQETKEEETKEVNLPTEKEQEAEKVVGDDSNKRKMGQLNILKKKIDKGLRQYIYERFFQHDPNWIGTLDEMKDYLTKVTDLIEQHTYIKKEFFDPYIYPTLNKWHFKISSEKKWRVDNAILYQFAEWIFKIRLDQIDTGDETKNQELKRFRKNETDETELSRRESVIYLIEEGKKIFTERGLSPEFWTKLNKRNIENW